MLLERAIRADNALRFNFGRNRFIRSTVLGRVTRSGRLGHFSRIPQKSESFDAVFDSLGAASGRGRKSAQRGVRS